jgi:hypothetical protein
MPGSRKRTNSVAFVGTCLNQRPRQISPQTQFARKAIDINDLHPGSLDINGVAK